MTTGPYVSSADIVSMRIEAIKRRQRLHYDIQHDRTHLAEGGFTAIGLVASYMAAGRWEDAAAMALNFAEAAALHPEEAPTSAACAAADWPTRAQDPIHAGCHYAECGCSCHSEEAQ